MTTHLTLHQGKTFQRTLRWYAPPFIYKPITAITQGAPVSITALAHGLISGWQAAVVSVKGMDEINALNLPPKLTDFKKVTKISVDVVEINEVVSADFKVYKSGGYLVYYTPVSLAGFTARLSIKNKVGGVVLFALVSPTHIVIDDTTKTISITVSAVDTATFAKGDYVYDLEMVSGTGVVSLLLSGKLTVVPEVTT